MPIHEYACIQVKEYECAWCGYKWWINRANDKDGYIPEICPKCECGNWINGEPYVRTPKEVWLVWCQWLSERYCETGVSLPEWKMY